MLFIVPRVTNVDGLATIIFASWRPIKAIKNPIPILIAYFNVCGTLLIIACLTLKKLSNKNIIPSINEAAKAVCHENFIVRQIVKVKKAFKPIPGAIPKG